MVVTSTVTTSLKIPTTVIRSTVTPHSQAGVVSSDKGDSSTYEDVPSAKVEIPDSQQYKGILGGFQDIQKSIIASAFG